MKLETQTLNAEYDIRPQQRDIEFKGMGLFKKKAETPPPPAPTRVDPLSPIPTPPLSTYIPS